MAASWAHHIRNRTLELVASAERYPPGRPRPSSGSRSLRSNSAPRGRQEPSYTPAVALSGSSSPSSPSSPQGGSSDGYHAVGEGEPPFLLFARDCYNQVRSRLEESASSPRRRPSLVKVGASVGLAALVICICIWSGTHNAARGPGQLVAIVSDEPPSSERHSHLRPPPGPESPAPAPMPAPPAPGQRPDTLPPWLRGVDSEGGKADSAPASSTSSSLPTPTTTIAPPPATTSTPVPTSTTTTPSAATTTTTGWWRPPGSSVQPAGRYFHLEGYNCWAKEASLPLPGKEDTIANQTTVRECKIACEQEGCSGMIFGRKQQTGGCWLRMSVDLSKCSRQPGRKHLDWDFYFREAGVPTGPSPAPIFEFYMYRATAEGMLHTYPFGEINLANLEGVLWYLMNEIVTEYSEGTRCPRRFGISEIHRLRVKTKATAPLFAEGMNFGARWAYDQGKCEGRCFSGNQCTGEGDCADHYNRFGNIVGCNRFGDAYPFPDMDTSFPDGVWYSLPLAGRCPAGSLQPSGEKDCTWTFSEAGMVTLGELEAISQGDEDDNCCEGVCTKFWHDAWDEAASKGRASAAATLFSKKFPGMPSDLPQPACDFKVDKWYSTDPWHRQDPWQVVKSEQGT